MTDAKTTAPATRALTDLVDTARARAARARADGLDGTAKTLDQIARTLDGARTRLIEDGIEYLDAAWAFVDAGRGALAGMHAAAPILDILQGKAN
jgi:hypothetical protein